ncbi:hypothetical protein D3C71_2188180 [compost metagenome]
MKRPAQFAQGRLTLGIGRPARQVLPEDFQDFIGFFEEHFPQLIVHRFFTGGRRQQASRDSQGGRVDGGHGAGQYIGQ